MKRKEKEEKKIDRYCKLNGLCHDETRANIMLQFFKRKKMPQAEKIILKQVVKG